MRNTVVGFVRKFVGVVVIPLFVAGVAWSEERGAPSPIGDNSVMAKTPFTDFTIGVMTYMLVIGALVLALLVGGFLVLNLGLMSKRDQDRIGGRTPSDLGILKNSTWPPEEDPTPVLPAEEDASEKAGAEHRGFWKRRRGAA